MLYLIYSVLNIYKVDCATYKNRVGIWVTGKNGKKFSKEEKIVNTMANGIMQVFVDNPWFMDYIKEQIDKEFGTSNSQTK